MARPAHRGRGSVAEVAIADGDMRRVGVVVAEEDVVPTIDEVETAAPKALGSGAESFRLHRRRVKKTLVEGMGALATAIVERERKATVRRFPNVFKSNGPEVSMQQRGLRGHAVT